MGSLRWRRSSYSGSNDHQCVEVAVVENGRSVSGA
ncbi:DUF397 domain-containing protein [Actinoallomurus sp. CA-150999]